MAAAAAEPGVIGELPKAEFIEDVAAFMSNKVIDGVLADFQASWFAACAGGGRAAGAAQVQIASEADPAARTLPPQERFRKFKLIESQLMQRRARLMSKLPEIQKALDIVTRLVDKSESGDAVTVDFELAEGVFAKSKVKGATTVNLWLGAGVMVEYPLKEAQELLTTNLSNCKHNLKVVNEDLEYNKDNITTTEVSIARMFNYDVERRRKEKEAEEKK